MEGGAKESKESIVRRLFGRGCKGIKGIPHAFQQSHPEEVSRVRRAGGISIRIRYKLRKEEAEKHIAP